MPGSSFHFDDLGIGALLHKQTLTVPPNQRPYAWEITHVATLFEDLYEAIERDDEDYFLGTIVLVQKGREVPSIADGQQRTATTSILLARIRDRQHALGRQKRAQSVDQLYLRSIDPATEESVPRLQLNVEDHDFFSNYILAAPYDDVQPEAMGAGDLRPSNEKLLAASRKADEFIDNLLAGHRAENHSDILLKWVDFIREKATVVVVTASDEVGAYRMFETLNDRGLKASQADILKNFLFSKSGQRTHEAQVRWNSVVASIESLADDPNQRLVTYIRHFWILTHGPTKERELAGLIKKEVTGESSALKFLNNASAAVDTYAALWSSRHPLWLEHRPGTRESIETIAQHLRVEQIRPLLFAIVRHFDVEEAEKALRLCVSWSVRFLVFGGRGGLLDQQYSFRAQEIGTGRISKARELREAMERHVPTDVEFQTAFATARVSRPRFARYYLRALEKTLRGERQPELVPNEDVRDITLDHILPLTPSDDWELDYEEAEAAQRLLGNMVLLRASDNRDLANKGFKAKRQKYATSNYLTTQMVAKADAWGLQDVKRRQEELAEVAVRTWPTTFG